MKWGHWCECSPAYDTEGLQLFWLWEWFPPKIAFNFLSWSKILFFFSLCKSFYRASIFIQQPTPAKKKKRKKKGSNFETHIHILRLFEKITFSWVGWKTGYGCLNLICPGLQLVLLIVLPWTSFICKNYRNPLQDVTQRATPFFFSTYPQVSSGGSVLASCSSDLTVGIWRPKSLRPVMSV